MTEERGQRVATAFAETCSTVCDAFAQPLDEGLSHVWWNQLPLQQDGTGDGGDGDSDVVLGPMTASSEESNGAQLGPFATARAADDKSEAATISVRIEQEGGFKELSGGQVMREKTNDNSESCGRCMRAIVSWLDHLSYRVIWTVEHFAEISWQARVWILMSAVALVYALFAVIVALVSWNGSEHCRAALGEHAVPTWILWSVMHIPIALSLARVSLRGCEEYTPKLVLGLLLFPLCLFGVIGAVAISPTHYRQIPQMRYDEYDGSWYTDYAFIRWCKLARFGTPSLMWVFYVAAVVGFSLIFCVALLIPCCSAYQARLRGIFDEAHLESLRRRRYAQGAM